MTDESPSFTSFFNDLMDRSHTRVKRAMDGLTEEQLYYRPTPDSNSIGWLVWHLSRSKDRTTALVSGEPGIWNSEDWATRFGLPESAHGGGDTPGQVASFRADRDLLIGYADAAHEASLRRVREATGKQLAQVPDFGGRPRPLSEWLIIEASDYAEHTGQIAYLRGMITGIGWYPS